VVCPNGVAKFDLYFYRCYGCETYDGFNTNIYTNYYYKKIYRDYMMIIIDRSMGSYNEKTSVFIPEPLDSNDG
jgi:hypothetical protein